MVSIIKRFHCNRLPACMTIFVLERSNIILTMSGGLMTMLGGDSVLLDMNGFGSMIILGWLSDTTICSSGSKSASPSTSTKKAFSGRNSLGG